MLNYAEDITILAGQKAYIKIKENGLHPKMVKIILGAAGGPKWLVLNFLDRILFSSWFDDRIEPLYLLGSSIGAWRFAAVCQKDPLEAIDQFQYAYLHQYYDHKPSPEEITNESLRIMHEFLNDGDIKEVLNHPYFHLSIMAVRSTWLTASDHRLLLAPGLIGAFSLNSVNRSWLRFFFSRALFFDSRSRPPFSFRDNFPVQKIQLNPNNFRQALLASGSIPLVMSGVKNIQGAKNGTYRDGGAIDYHMNIPVEDMDEGIVLFPHYVDRIIPGWLDKKLSWRKPSRSDVENVVLVAPSPKFVQRLPHQKIPDRNDFFHYAGRDKARIAAWQTVIEESKRFGEAFIELVESGKIRDFVRPMK